MTDFKVSWAIIFHNIIPFAAAQLFLVVLIYFSLVRERIASEYPFYATFLICFILYLSSTLVIIMPLDIAPYYVHYISCTLLYSAGFPSLLVALFIQSKLRIPYYFIGTMCLLGLFWSALYIITADYYMLKVNLFFETAQKGTPPSWINFSMVYNLQSLIFIIELIIPGLYLLKKTNNQSTKAYVYGMLILATFAVIGSSTEQWAIYYAGSSLCAFAWGWALFKDIGSLNDKLKAHHAHEKNFALAQFASQGKGMTTEELYPDTLDESYPFREREELLEVVRTASTGLINERTTNMIYALYSFSHQHSNVLKARVREMLYLLVDTTIYLGGAAKELIIRLEEKGHEIDRCIDNHSLEILLADECHYLAQQVNVKKRHSGVDSLVERIKSYVLAHFHKEELNIDSIAQGVGVSRSHAMKSFKGKYDITLNQYITQVRIEKAKSFLLEKTVTETAFDVGFKSSNYFSTFFSKHVGITPKQFQQQANGVTSKNKLEKDK